MASIVWFVARGTHDHHQASEARENNAMTEDEAKTKFCCGPSVAGVYRDEFNPYTRCCAGSACMAWRWEAPEIQRRWTAEGEPAPGPDWERDTDAKPSKDDRFAKLFWRRNPQGSCGLAGAPR